MRPSARLALTRSLAAIGAIGCATTRRGAPSASPLSVPLAASSIPSGYGIQLRVQGTAEIRDDWLYVVVPQGAIRTLQGKAPAWDLLLRAGLATCTGGREWKVVSESRAARLAPLVGFTRDSSMLDTTSRAFRDTLRLDFGVPRGTRLDRAWVVFDLAWPISNVMATYTLATGTPLVPSAPQVEPSRVADVRCRD